jgi:hypothetical protein
MPSWVHLIILAGMLPWLIICLLMRKAIRVQMPMCSRHLHHWSNRKLIVWLGLLFWIAYAITFAVALEDIPNDMRAPIVAGGILGGLSWLITAGIVQNQAIRAAKITDYGADIVNVNKKFAEAWRMYCDAVDEKERQARKSRRRKYEEDDDED